MAICKDCFHWESCRAMFEAAGGIIVPDDFKGSDVRCKHFVSTADVAPRAEVARDIFRDVRNILNKHYYDCYQYEDGDECDAVITYLSYVAVDFDEIEKKYTEPEPPEGD